MKKNVIIFGLISGIIVASLMTLNVALCYQSNNFDRSIFIGYAAMIIALAFVFVGIKNQRDKYNGGYITLGQALKTGLFITLIASTIYVLVWMITYYNIMPDFMDRYSEYEINKIKASGKPAAEISEKLAEMAKYKDWLKNPLFIILFTYLEILQVALPITLVSALILKRKQDDPTTAAVA